MSYVIRGAGRVRWIAGIALGITLAFGATAQAAPQYEMDCNSCHSMPPLDSGTLTKNPENGAVPGNHQLHAGTAASSCVVCHNQNPSEVTSYGNSHRNKNIELNTGLGYTRQVGGFMNQTSVPPNPLGTCATAACHSDGTLAAGHYRTTPDWKSAPFAAPGNCNACHGVAPATGNHPTTGTKHAAYFGTGVGSCAKCHTSHDLEAKPFSHATSAGKRSIEVKFAGGGSFASNQCSNLNCHSNGQGTFVPPTWGGTLTCVGCHGNATSDTLSGKHASHVNNGVLGSYGCVDCHSTTVSNNTTISNFTNHVNTAKDVFGAKVGTAVTGTCATTQCHQDGKGTQKTVTWSGAALECNGCHGSAAPADPAFAANFAAPNYLNAGADQLFANSHVKHVKASGDCQNCHSSTTTTGLAVIGNHLDGNITVLQGNGKTFAHDAGNDTCSAISCHGNGKFTPAPIKWGAATNCANCHGTAAPTLGGAHAVHLSISYYGCASCHGATVSSNTVISTAAKHMDSVLDVAGGKITTFDSGVDKSCTNSCHIGVTAPKWNEPATGGCGTCHNVQPSGLNNAHATHATALNGPRFADNAASCTSCHIYTGPRVTPHADGTKDLKAGFTVTAGCTGCHNQPIDWAAGAIACEKCHTGDLSVIGGITAPAKNAAATSGHGKAPISQGCVACHDSASAHINGGLADIDNRLKAGLTGSDNAECNYCHTTAGTIITAEKLKSLNLKAHRAAGLGSKCSDCHDPHGTANSMMVKTTIDSTAISFTGNSTFANAGRTGVCQACHMTTDFFTKAGQPVATHVDSTTNCLDCHQHNPATGLAFMANGGCDACHGYPPAPRVTTDVVTFGLQNNWSSARFEDYSGGGGAHLVAGHIPKSVRPIDGWTPCLPCHSGGSVSHARALPARSHVDNVSVLVDPQYRFSQGAFMSYTTAQLVNGGANKTGSCFNVSCHFKKSPKWSTER